MGIVEHIFWWICLIFLVLLFARTILSYFSIMPGSPLEALSSLAFTVTEPILRPIRRLIPPARIGGGAMDLSPIIVFFAVFIVMNLLL